MNQQLWVAVVLACYFLLFLVVVGSVGLWMVKRRRTRPPLEFKLLRAPGESLRQRMNRFDEDGFFKIGAAALVPLAAALATMGLLIWLTPKISMTRGLFITAAVFIPFLIGAAYWSIRQMDRYRNDGLGYLGERAVGEELLPLLASGYRVYHDVPAEARGKKFNIDHVAVGPNGIFAIETKTRRKGRARAGFEDHKVAYDGTKLIWPWAEDSFGLEQAETRARWLTEWINGRTGLQISARPVLVLPGWYVLLKAVGPITVVNHKQIAGTITRGGQRLLTDEQIDLIARQLDDRCRNVEQ